MEAMIEKYAEYALQNGGEVTMLCADFVVREVSGQHVPYLVEFNMRMSAQYGGLAMVHHLFGEPEPSAHGYIGNISVPNNGGTPADVQQYFDFLQKEGVLPDGAEPHANAIYPMNFTIRGTVQGLMVAKSAAELQELRALATMQHSTSQSS